MCPQLLLFVSHYCCISSLCLCSRRRPLTKEAQISLIGVVHQMITDGNLKFAQLLRDALVVKVGMCWEWEGLCSGHIRFPCFSGSGCG